jgi:hypothetical protein
MLYRNPAAYFADGKYLLADLAFNNTNHTVSTFWLPARGIRLPQDQHNFHQAVSALRVANEHTIGILKNSFQILKKLLIQVTEAVELNLQLIALRHVVYCITYYLTCLKMKMT